MTIGGLVYGPTLGAPVPNPWANVFTGISAPTFLSEIAPYGFIRTGLSAVDFWRRAYTPPTVGIDNLADATRGGVQPEGPYTEGAEICWRNVDTGQEACFLSGSIFQPGGVWGPAGNWEPTSPTHPPPIDPEYLPTRRVEETVVPLHEEAGWVQGLLGAANTLFGGIGGVSPNFAAANFPSAGAAPGGIPELVNGGGPMSYAGSCPPRKTRTLTIDCATGQEVKRTRRRRRRLLTSSDLGDLAQLQALVGKGSNAMSVAVSKAIR